MDANSLTLLGRLFESVARCFTTETARALIESKCDPKVQARVDELAEKCNEGLLTEQEREEYHTYVEVGTFISILKVKARVILREASDVPP